LHVEAFPLFGTYPRRSINNVLVPAEGNKLTRCELASRF
jgi:hypothetical protein